MLARLSFFLILLFCSLSQAQEYNEVDKKTRDYPAFTKIADLSDRIKKDFPKKHNQVRAIFVWLTHNIRYDINEYKHINFSGTFQYETEEELQEKLRAIDLNVINRAWKYKKTVCEGYSLLFKELCDNLGIESDVIRGYTKTQPKEIGTDRETLDHIWNVVKLEGKWKLIDSTWGAGYLMGSGWQREFNDDYFLVNPERLMLTHFPENPKWQLQKKKIDRKTFFNYPIYYAHAFFYDLELTNPFKGILKSSNNTITISFNQIPKDAVIRYAYDSEPNTTTLSFNTENNNYVASIPLKRDPYLTLYINGVSVLDFKVSP